MKTFITTTLLACCVAGAERYNILSLDAAKYKGYMTSTFIGYLEQNAYVVARRDFCIDERVSERIAMPELFDIIAGSETGAIIATSLVLPNTDPATNVIQPNLYFATRSQQFFRDNVDSLYHDSKMPAFVKFVITLFIISLIGAAVYFGSEKAFYVEDFDERVDELQVLIKLRKRAAKGKSIDETQKNQINQTLDKIHNRTTTLTANTLSIATA